MCKLWGALFLMAGSIGFSYSICRELRVRLNMLKEAKYMYELMQSEIRYTGLPFPLVFDNIAPRLKSPFREMLRNITKYQEAKKETELPEIWKHEVQAYLGKLYFTKQQQEALLGFDKGLGMIDKEGQAKVIQRQIDELSVWITCQEKEEKMHRKVIMGVGVGLGALTVIILI